MIGRNKMLNTLWILPLVFFVQGAYSQEQTTESVPSTIDLPRIFEEGDPNATITPRDDDFGKALKSAAMEYKNVANSKKPSFTVLANQITRLNVNIGGTYEKISKRIINQLIDAYPGESFLVLVYEQKFGSVHPILSGPIDSSSFVYNYNGHSVVVAKKTDRSIINNKIFRREKYMLEDEDLTPKAKDVIVHLKKSKYRGNIIAFDETPCYYLAHNDNDNFHNVKTTRFFGTYRKRVSNVFLFD